MRAVVVHDSEILGRSARRMVLGAGLECLGEDFVSYSNLEDRLARGDAGVIVVRIGENPVQAVDLAAKAVALCQSAVFAVGPLNDEALERQLREAGATYLKDENAMQTQFDSAVDSFVTSRGETHRKGRVISVLAPTSGSGGTTVAINLAGAFSKSHPQGTVLVEMGRHVSDLPTRLHYKANLGTNDVCRRWEQLDSTSLQAGLTRREPGLNVLAHTSQEESNYEDDPLQPAAVRRVGVLLRANYPVSVWKLDSVIDDECVEALRLSDQVLLVIRPDVLCVRRAQQAIALADNHGIDPKRFLLIGNRWGQPGQLTRKQIEKSLGMPLFQLIPDEPKWANLALNRGKMFHELSRSAVITRRFAKLARLLEQRAK